VGLEWQGPVRQDHHAVEGRLVRTMRLSCTAKHFAWSKFGRADFTLHFSAHGLQTILKLVVGMGQFSVANLTAAGSVLSDNQH